VIEPHESSSPVDLLSEAPGRGQAQVVSDEGKAQVYSTDEQQGNKENEAVQSGGRRMMPLPFEY
jgi:hypothetical protein